MLVQTLSGDTPGLAITHQRPEPGWKPLREDLASRMYYIAADLQANTTRCYKRSESALQGIFMGDG